MKTRIDPKVSIWPRHRVQLLFGLPLILIYMAVARCLAQEFTLLHEFPSRSWDWANGTLLVTNGTLFGTTEVFGESNKGTIFAVATNGTGFNVIKSFAGGKDGDAPLDLALDGATLYGVTCFGGTSNHGTVFRLNTDGSGFAVIKNFLGLPGDGAEPMGGLVLSGQTLYGTTRYAGDYVFGGTVFKLDTGGAGYRILKSFTGLQGAYPNAGLAQVGETLYGTTGGGGVADKGTIFKLNSDGSEFAVLRSFTYTNQQGYSPKVGLVVSGDKLYGTTTWLAKGGMGAVYRMDTNGGDYQVLKGFFDPGEGSHPQSGLLCIGDCLFGTTWSGGTADRGVVFQLNCDGSGFRVLKHFLGADGANPNSALVALGRTLYGMTAFGGTNDGGVLFGLSFPAPTVRITVSGQTAAIGEAVSLHCRTTSVETLRYAWYFNTTNFLGSSENGSCEINPVQTRHSGTYQVVVSDAFGAVTSAPMVLNVIVPIEWRLVPALRPSGEAGKILNLEHSESLAPSASWSPLATVMLTSPPQWYFDLSESLTPQCYYRAWQSAPATNSSLELPVMIPALTLTGNVGRKLRLDGINRIGPVDAWYPLATVLLTNTSQLYFDTSVIGEPSRLWRVVPLP